MKKKINLSEKEFEVNSKVIGEKIPKGSTIIKVCLSEHIKEFINELLKGKEVCVLKSKVRKLAGDKFKCH